MEMFNAACEGNVGLVEYLVATGQNINGAHPERLLTLLVATILARQETMALRLLERGANPNLRAQAGGLTPIQAARCAGLQRVVDRLLLLGASEPAARRAHIWQHSAKRR
jgi:hypothetical protein